MSFFIYTDELYSTVCCVWKSSTLNKAPLRPPSPTPPLRRNYLSIFLEILNFFLNIIEVYFHEKNFEYSSPIFREVGKSEKLEGKIADVRKNTILTY